MTRRDEEVAPSVCEEHMQLKRKRYVLKWRSVVKREQNREEKGKIGEDKDVIDVGVAVT